MDPNATLAEIREIGTRVLNGNVQEDDADRLATLIAALDGWLTSGGFLPAEWAR